MAYRPIAIDHIKDPILHEVFEHADIYLRDVYSMLAIDESVTGGGPCNFSIALVLLWRGRWFSAREAPDNENAGSS